VTIDDHGQVFSVPCGPRSRPEGRQAREQVASLLGFGATVRHAIRISTQIAVFEVLTVSHATVSSKLRVNPASWRAHGTAATTTSRAPCTPRAARRPPRSRPWSGDPAPASAAAHRPGHSPGSAGDNAGSDHAASTAGGPTPPPRRPGRPRPLRRPSYPAPKAAAHARTPTLVLRTSPRSFPRVSVLR
jgi:hypothetical protein